MAIRRDRFVATLAGMIHLLPASVAIAIGLLNSIGYYIGEELAGPQGQDDEKFADLQLAAKLHELTIQASITAMLLQYVHHELALRDSLPFRALFAGQLYKDISYLWSSEFWGTANGFYGDRKRKWRLVILLVVCAILGLTVGPSSANILKPRSGNWAAGGTDFYINAPSEALWSTQITTEQVPSGCHVDTGDRSCPYGDWQTLARDYLPYWSRLQDKGYLPGVVRIPGLKSIRELYPQTRSSSQQYAQSFTVATMQFSTVADAIAETGRLWAWVVAAAWRTKGQPWRFWSHTEATFTVSAYQPVVHARCSNSSSSPSDKFNATVALYDLSDLEAFRRTGDFPIRPSNLTASASTNVSGHGNPIIWYTIPQASKDRNALGAIVRLLNYRTKLTEVYPCTIDARIAPSKVQSTRNTYGVVTSHVEDSTLWMPAGTAASYGGDDSWPDFNIDPQWARYLNPSLGSDNTTAFDLMTASAGLQDSHALDDADRGYVIESVLSLMVANGLARTNYNNGIVGELRGWDFEIQNPICGEWCNGMMPHDKAFGRGGSVYSLNATTINHATRLTMFAQVSGYAYSPRGFTTILSIVVLFLYSFIVLVHWGYMIWVMESSDSWQSSAEIAALAINSRPTHLLQNTGAGVGTSKIFKNRVKVVSVGEKIELSFQEHPDEEKIALNAWYS